MYTKQCAQENPKSTYSTHQSTKLFNQFAGSWKWSHQVVLKGKTCIKSISFPYAGPCHKLRTFKDRQSSKVHCLGNHTQQKTQTRQIKSTPYLSIYDKSGGFPKSLLIVSIRNRISKKDLYVNEYFTCIARLNADFAIIMELFPNPNAYGKCLQIQVLFYTEVSTHLSTNQYISDIIWNSRFIIIQYRCLKSVFFFVMCIQMWRKYQSQYMFSLKVSNPNIWPNS